MTKAKYYFTILMNRLAEEEGLETVEWAGMVVVMVALLGAVTGFITSGDAQIGQAILDVFENWIRALGG
ncbi:MAG: hypothetical protein QNJ45_14590 [Ardenticatenaceae bacterium]|nr:hypothetical protein [Ardenticatenaceae bacterium]